MQHIVNAQGLNMPKLGLGTWPMLGEACTRAVEQALALGYRHIDTAAAYNNEDAVGQALLNSKAPREQIHVTSKVCVGPVATRRHAPFHGPQPQGLAQRLHRPFHDPLAAAPIGTCRGMIETLVSFKGKGWRAILAWRISRSPAAHRRRELGAPLSAIQVEYHVLLGQNALLDYARQHDLALTAYSPLARNRVIGCSGYPADRRQARGIADPGRTQMAAGLQLNVAAIPKASSEANQLANLAALAVNLDDLDRALIAGLSKRERLVSPTLHRCGTRSIDNRESHLIARHLPHDRGLIKPYTFHPHAFASRLFIDRRYTPHQSGQRPQHAMEQGKTQQNVNDIRKGKDARTLTGTTLAAGLAAIALASAGLYSTRTRQQTLPSSNPRTPWISPALNHRSSNT